MYFPLAGMMYLLFIKFPPGGNIILYFCKDDIVLSRVLLVEHLTQPPSTLKIKKMEGMVLLFLAPIPPNYAMTHPNPYYNPVGQIQFLKKVSETVFCLSNS